MTLADIRLFVTLIRFDPVYIVYFKTNTRSVTYTPALLNYCRDIYQMPGVADTVNMEQIKVHYFASHPG
jgi:putative glutathione S-transferase